MSNVVAVKPAPRNEQVVSMLREVLELAERNPDTSELFVLMRSEGDYHRFSCGLDDLMRLVSVLELAKHDVISRMET